MAYRFAGRMGRVPESFLDELFRVSAVPGVISFAGGLPGSAYIDLEGIRDAAREVFAEVGRTALLAAVPRSGREDLPRPGGRRRDGAARLPRRDRGLLALRARLPHGPARGGRTGSRGVCVARPGARTKVLLRYPELAEPLGEDILGREAARHCGDP